MYSYFTLYFKNLFSLKNNTPSDNLNNKLSENKLLKKKIKRFIDLIEIKSTLQGNILIGFDDKLKKKICIKKSLLKNINNNIDFKGRKIEENFRYEISILKKLNLLNKDTYNGVPKYIDDWEDNTFLNLVIEKCHIDLFDYYIKMFKKENISKSFESINSKNTYMENKKISQKFIFTKKIFRQLIKTIHWFHNDIKICHLDLSLENLMLLNDSKTEPKLKIIDFGLCQDFSKKSNFLYNKFIGKLYYQSPEVFKCNKYYKKTIPNFYYDARKADVWSIGIVLFVLLFGEYPYKYASKKYDRNFRKILGGPNTLEKWVTKNNKTHLLTLECLDLLKKILTFSKKRLTINEILIHPFVKE